MVKTPFSARRARLLAAIALALFGAMRPAAAADPMIDVTPSSVDFGAVTVGQFVDRAFTIRNVCQVPLIGSVGSVSEPFSIVSGGGSFNLPPGGTRQVVVRFAPGSPVIYHRFVAVTSNDPDESRVDVQLTGQGIEQGPDPPPTDATPPTVSLRFVPVGRITRKGGRFQVLSTVSDDQDANPERFLYVLTPTPQVTPTYRRSRREAILVDPGRGRVLLLGPDATSLQNRWNLALAAGGFEMADGQTILWRVTRRSRVRFRFVDGTVAAVQGGLTVLLVGRDAAGNEAALQQSPTLPPRR